MPNGSKVEGATTRTRAPSVLSRMMFAGHPRMQDIAADRHHEPLDAPFVAADGQRVEQRLGRVLVRPVAGIDHRAVDLLGEELDRTRRVMAHHQDVRVHGVERHRGVDQGLALAHGRGVDRHVHHVGAEPLAGQLERRLGAGRGLEEQVDLGAAAQRGAFLLDLTVEVDEFLAEVEEAGDLLVRKPFDKHLIFYRVCGDTLDIVRIVHGRRDLPRRLLDPPGAE